MSVGSGEGSNRPGGSQALVVEQSSSPADWKQLEGRADRPRCGNCAHWDPAKVYVSSPFRPCRAVVHDEHYHAGRRLNDEPLGEYDHELDAEREASLQEQMAEDSAYGAKLKAEVAAIRKHLAVVQDGSGFNAALKTREDFGCVLWKRVAVSPSEKRHAFIRDAKSSFCAVCQFGEGSWLHRDFDQPPPTCANPSKKCNRPADPRSSVCKDCGDFS